MADDPRYEALLDELRALASGPGGGEFTRQNIIALINVLARHLDHALATPIGSVEDGTEVAVQHPVGEQLEALSDALGDLDVGLTDPILRPNSYGANNTRGWALRNKDERLAEALNIYMAAKPGMKLRTAARDVARLLKEERRGRPLTGRRLEKIYYRYNSTR